MYRWPRIGLPPIVLALIAVLKPVWYVTAVTVAPFNFVVVGIALSFAVASLLSQAGAPWGRAVVASTTAKTQAGPFDRAGLRAFIGSFFGPFFRESVGSFFAPFLNRDRNDDVRAYRYGGTRHSLAQWINAAFIESARSAWQGMFFRQVFVALYAAFLYIASGQIGLIAIVIVQSGPQLSGVLPYPLSRLERTHVQFACNLLETIVTGGAAWLVFMLLEANGAPRAFAEDVSVLQFQRRWPMELAALMVCMPFAQWARAMGPLPVNTMAMVRSIIPMSLLILGVVVIPRSLDRLLGHPPLSTILLVLAATGVVVQVLYYLALRYVYARRDLWRDSA